MSTKIDKSKASTIFDDDDLLVMAAGAGAGSGGGGSGNQGSGVGGGGGSPGGGNPGGGGGGKPGGESFGNNLSFPAIFFDTPTTLRGSDGSFTFTTPKYLAGDTEYVYFAQGVEGNTWRADYTVVPGPPSDGSIKVDYVDIGDALESAPIKSGTNVRLELALYQDVVNPDEGEPGYGAGETLTGFEMTLLGGAKGGGKPDKVGPTESQGARLDADEWVPGGMSGNTDSPIPGTTYESDLASIYAAESSGGEGEATNAYMSASVQKVTGVASLDDLLAGLIWDGESDEWEVTASAATVDPNLVNTAFGPELNIAGKYIMGASGKPFKFTSDGDYLITFALEEGSPLCFDDDTEMTNVAGARETWIIPDGDTHNGLLVMLVGVPSSADTGEGYLA